MMEYISKQDTFFDPSTGIYLIPSYHGEECPGNGENTGIECCCDECDWYLRCFSDWKDFLDGKMCIQGKD